MSSPQNSAGRYKQKARATKQLAEWRLRNPAKPKTAATSAAPAASTKAAAPKTASR
jgi:hypothetical protein